MRKLTKLAIRSIGLLCSFVLAVNVSAQSDIFLGDTGAGGNLQVFGVDVTGLGDNVLDAELSVDESLNIELTSTQASATVNENVRYNQASDVLQVLELSVGAFSYWANFPLIGLQPTRFGLGSNGVTIDMCQHQDWIINWNTGGLPDSDLEVFCDTLDNIEELSLPPGAQGMTEPSKVNARLEMLYECEVETRSAFMGFFVQTVITCADESTYFRSGEYKKNTSKFREWLREIANQPEFQSPSLALTLPQVDPKAMRCILGLEVQHFGFIGTEGKVCPKDNGPTLFLGEDDRFAVETVFTDAESNTGPGTAGRITLDSGDFWFRHPEVSDVVVKVFDGCDLPGFNHFFVFAEGFTDMGVEITVTNTDTAEMKVYNNPLGTPFEAITDTEAFACP